MNQNVNIQKLGNKLRELRIEKGLSQRELASSICSSSTVSQIENGTYPSIPSAEILNGLCEKLGTTLGELFADAELDSEALENDVLIDILTVLLHRNEFEEANRVIHELDSRQNLLVYQKNKLMICHGDYLLKQGNYHQAVDYLTEFQKQLEMNRETDEHLLANLYNRIGTAWYLIGNMIHAYNYYFRAYQQCLRFPEMDMLCANVSYNLGNTCRWLRFDTQAKSFLEQAKLFFDKLSDQRSLADSLYVLGIVHKNMKDFILAGEYIKHSLAIYESLEIIDWVHVAKRTYAFHIIGSDNPQEAVKVLIDSASVLEGSNEKELAFTYAQIAHLFMELNDVEQSLTYLNLANDMFQNQTTGKSPLVYAYILMAHAKYYLKIKEFKNSVQFAFKSSEILDKMRLHKEMADSLQIAYQAYKESGELSKALEVSEQIMSTLREEVESYAILDRNQKGE